MNEEDFPGSDIPVDEIMRRWPATIRVMMRHRFHCVGCPIGPFHTVSDACAAHGTDEEVFRSDLLQAIEIGEGAISEEGSRRQASDDGDPRP